MNPPVTVVIALECLGDDPQTPDAFARFTANAATVAYLQRCLAGNPRNTVSDGGRA